jgi:hypothetical protein
VKRDRQARGQEGQAQVKVPHAAVQGRRENEAAGQEESGRCEKGAARGAKKGSAKKAARKGRREEESWRKKR